ncbi:MAG: hypothetical protein R3F14_08880 [Polyangiaceae bacterium]
MRCGACTFDNPEGMRFCGRMRELPLPTLRELRLREPAGPVLRQVRHLPRSARRDAAAIDLARH